MYLQTSDFFGGPCPKKQNYKLGNWDNFDQSEVQFGLSFQKDKRIQKSHNLC